jgi:hypothetical protein
MGRNLVLYEYLSLFSLAVPGCYFTNSIDEKRAFPQRMSPLWLFFAAFNSDNSQ